MKKSINKFLLLQPVLEKITDGGMFRFLFAWFFRALGLLALLSTLYASWEMWGNINSNMPVKYFIGGVILQIFIAGIGYVIFNIFFIRANDIDDLPSTKDYSITPIITIFWRTMGEILAAMYVVVGLALGVATFVIGGNVGNLLPFSLPGLSSGGGSSGLVIMIAGGFFAVLILFFFYYIAELASAVVDTARYTSILANQSRRK